MPRKAAARKSKTESQVEKKSSRKSKSSSKGRGRKKKEEVAELPVVPEETVSESVAETVSESVAENAPVKKKRHVPTRESVSQEFDDLLASVEEEITRLRESATKAKGVKFLRSVGKKVKTLRSHAQRVMKTRRTTNRKNNKNSGFQKPVRISKELAKFAGWPVDELRSRVDVTKHICNYIKEHDLQLPEDRRQIRIEDDAKLKKLLKFDSKKDKNPLTYYSLQTYLKSHFPKDDVVAEAPAKAAKSSKKKSKKSSK
jgi:upstream activation factor subunit UAF30